MARYYSHTQTGTFMIVVAALAFAFGLWSISAQGGLASLAILIIALLLAFMFPTMTIHVVPDEVRMIMGAGLIRKRFPTSEIKIARKVRNPWYYGWGIRWFPGGWLFNVSGLDAVEIEMESGRKYRLGTDDPDQLLRAIEVNADL
jgi:hypothetical protein